MFRFPIPGTQSQIFYDVQDGHLARITLNGKCYLRRRGSTLIFEDGWLQFHEQQWGRTLFRKASTAKRTWLETYAFDEAGLPTLVDGTTVHRNPHGYVTSCSAGSETWHYRYSSHQLIEIDGPNGRRTMTYGNQHQVRQCAENETQEHYQYASSGQRTDTPPENVTWHRDDQGRLWTIKDSSGTILHTFLWWGFSCLARMDGPPGAPIAAVFSLDATGTPVRVTTREKTTRFMRDAFGENLHRDPLAPGLFGGVQQGRFIHYRSRVLDTKTGSFTAPDPFDGSVQDPRRHQGYAGSLPVEQPPSGPYHVCQHDPIGRLDPTGEMSEGVGNFFTTLGSLTWAFQNNLSLLTTFGFWNILAALGSFKGKNIAQLTDLESLYAEYTGSYGLRINPVGLGSA